MALNITLKNFILKLQVQNWIRIFSPNTEEFYSYDLSKSHELFNLLEDYGNYYIHNISADVITPSSYDHMIEEPCIDIILDGE